MNATYAIGSLLVAAGVGLGAARFVSWRRANRPVRLEIESGLTELDQRRNAEYPIYRELYTRAGYAVGVSQSAVLVAAHAAGLVNERYSSKSESPAPWERSYLEPAAADCVRVLQPDYEGLHPDNEADADAWIADLERAGYNVTRGQVALDRAYARVLNEEFEHFDRVMGEAFAKFDAVASAEIVQWSTEWAEFTRTHPIEAATVEIRGIQEWIDNELAADTAASIVAEMTDTELDDEAATLAGTTQ